VTNDRLLRKKCKAEGVEVLWGLELIVCLCFCGGITQERAKSIGKKIHENNPQNITQKIYADFSASIDSVV
jgi:hypothetical protein